jgi:hypothetical protein
MPRLIVTSGPLVGRRIEINRELTIGGAAASLDIHDDEASSLHAMLRSAGDEVEVKDLGSGTGTWVDGERIDQPATVGDGAALRVGLTTFIVEIDASADARDRTRPLVPTLPASPPATLPASPPATASYVPPTPYAPPTHGHRRRADTRRWGAAAASFATILATAAALVIYFALR